MPAVYYSINNIFNQKPVPVIVKYIQGGQEDDKA
jgi:hypothetical protein